MHAASLISTLALAATAVASEPPAAHGAEPSTPLERPRFVVEYLPAFAYDRESISLRFRVENPRAAPLDCTVEAALSPSREDASPAESPEAVRLRVPPGQKRSAGFELPVSGWSRAEVRFEAEGGAPAASAKEAAREVPLVIRRFGEDDDIPTLEAAGDRLYVRRAPSSRGPGDAAVLTLAQRVGEDDREWLMVKLLAQRLGEGTPPAGVLLLGARLTRARSIRGGARSRVASGSFTQATRRGDEPAYLRAVREGAGTWVQTAALPGEGAANVTYPILADFAAALASLQGARPAELVVWVVACDDARRGTPVRTFRKAADFLLHRALDRLGRVTVLFVPEPAVPPKRRALYSEALRKAALACRVSFVRVDALEKRAFWTGEAAGSRRPLLRFPNPEGHAALAEAVLECIRP